MLISAPLLLLWWQDGVEEGASSLVFLLLLQLGTKMRKGDVAVPGALYSEPGSGRMEGGMGREKMKREKAADREEESTETV